MSQGPLCPNLTQKIQREVSQMANQNFSCTMLLGGLSVNLNHLKMEPKTESKRSDNSFLSAFKFLYPPVLPTKLNCKLRSYQGSYFFSLTKFHDISMIFPGFWVNFQVFFHYFLSVIFKLF